jgi:MoxR-like ATPase
MIKLQNELTGVVKEFNDLFEAASELGGMKIRKDDSAHLRRLKRYGWFPLKGNANTTNTIADGIASLINDLIKTSGVPTSQIDEKKFDELVNKVESLSNDYASNKAMVIERFINIIKMQDESIEQIKMINDRLNTRKVDEIVIKQKGKKDIKVEGQHKQFGTLLRILSARLNAILIGPAGSGKTTAAEKVAETLALKYYSMSVGAQTTKFEFFGYMDANGKYVRTLFREAFENGGIFLIDEMDAGNANVIVSINQALANCVCAFPDGMIKKHPDFVVLASANTWGSGASREYVGRNQLDAATKDRFIPIVWEYDTDLEDSMTPNKEWLAEVRRVRKAVEQHKIRQVISPRASIYGSKLLDAGMDWDEVRKMVLLKDMNESEILNVNNTK